MYTAEYGRPENSPQGSGASNYRIQRAVGADRQDDTRDEYARSNYAQYNYAQYNQTQRNDTRQETILNRPSIRSWCHSNCRRHTSR